MQPKSSHAQPIRFQTGAAVLLLALGAATSTLFTQTQQCSVFSLSATSMVFDATGGNGTVACDKGFVSNNVYTGCAWTATSNVSWIVINSGANSNQAGYGIVFYTVQPNAGPMSRTGTITFSSGQYQNATYTVMQGSASSASSSSPFSAAPAALYFYYQPGGAIPAAQTLNVVSNVSGGTQFSAFAITKSPAAWLGVNPANGNAGSSGAAITVTLNGDALTQQGGLKHGAYTGEVLIFGAGVGTILVPVTLVVNSVPAPLNVPASLKFQYDPNHPESPPPSQALAVTSNNGPTTFTFSAIPLTPRPPSCLTAVCTGPSWLTFSSGASAGSTNGSGATVPNASGTLTTPATITVSVSPAGLNLPPGRYTTAVRYAEVQPLEVIGLLLGSALEKPGSRDAAAAASAGSAGCAGQAQSTVTLTVGSIPLIANPDPLAFNDQTQQQTLTVSQFQQFTQLPLLAPTIATCPDGWLSINPNTASVTGSPYNLKVSTAMMDPLQGPYGGTVTFTDMNNDSTAVQVSATPGSNNCAWSSDPGPFSFFFDGTNFPASQSPNIYNSCVNTAVVTSTSDSNWASVATSIQAIPGPLTISASPSVLQSLCPGNYGGSVTVSQFGADAPPLSLALSLTVTQPGSAATCP